MTGQSRRSPAATARRRAALLLTLAMLALHVGVGEQLADAARELALHAPPGAIRRMKAQFVVELRPSAPSTADAVPPAPSPQRRADTRRARRASTASSAASAARVEAVDETAAAVPPALGAGFEEALLLAAQAAAVASEPAVAAAAAAEAAPAASEPPRVDVAGPAQGALEAAPTPRDRAFDWPRSTRLSYQLTGHYRGPVHGSARVEWLRQGSRYQVHVEVAVGPSLAPLVSRRLSSDGEIRPEGLHPRVYEELTQVALQAPRRNVVHLGEDDLRLANGVALARPDGVQDSASQFVQMTWLFITQPQRLRPGQTVDLMLALPRRVDRWTYDIGVPETVHTTQGPIEAVPVKPRPIARPGGELSAQLWVAPTLQHLPVRIVIRQDADTYVDLLLDRLPEQAAEPVR